MQIDSRVRFIETDNERILSQWGTVTEFKGDDYYGVLYFVVWDDNPNDNDYYAPYQLSES